MNKTLLLSLLVIATLLSGCFSDSIEYEGIRFPKTTGSEITFQELAIPSDCSAFAHLLMTTKMNSTGKDIGDAMHREAQGKGANLVLVGMTRDMEDEELEENRFDYYGPEYAYKFNTTWLGWKFGFDEWNDAGALVGMGATQWGNSAETFSNTLVIQAVFLRCGQDR